jgi:DNA modification methylase
VKTQHTIRFAAAAGLEELEKDCVDLVVTSPPYPMIQMWDGLFGGLSPKISTALTQADGPRAFELMHEELDQVWMQLHRILKPGGLVCINVGDATRTLASEFRLYPNHARIVQQMNAVGFHSLPEILWRKQTNAPTKFMGSGMLPAGAYVTLEHEFILVFRKGSRREFVSQEQKQVRRQSALFWEERNAWFSDVWMDVKGIGQELGASSSRARSAAFPFELPYRLISMFSVRGDLVLDPFLGTGTTTAAAMASCRNSLGFEVDDGLAGQIEVMTASLTEYANRHLYQRLQRHTSFVSMRSWPQDAARYTSQQYGFPVVTRQEKEIRFDELVAVLSLGANRFEVNYRPLDLPDEF